jgi:hypothetical protein
MLGAALRDRGVQLGAAILAVYVGLEASVGDWGFSYLVQARGLTESLAGYAVSEYWLGMTLGPVPDQPDRHAGRRDHGRHEVRVSGRRHRLSPCLPDEGAPQCGCRSPSWPAAPFRLTAIRRFPRSGSVPPSRYAPGPALPCGARGRIKELADHD